MKRALPGQKAPLAEASVMRLHFVHWAITAGHPQLRKIHSKFNAADILTKASTLTHIYADLCRCIMGY
jgi:hypothetical protein